MWEHSSQGGTWLTLRDNPGEPAGTGEADVCVVCCVAAAADWDHEPHAP